MTRRYSRWVSRSLLVTAITLAALWPLSRFYSVQLAYDSRARSYQFLLDPGQLQLGFWRHIPAVDRGWLEWHLLVERPFGFGNFYGYTNWHLKLGIGAIWARQLMHRYGQ